MAKKEEDVGKRVSKLEQEVKKLSAQKVESTTERITGLEDQVDYVKRIAGFQKEIAEFQTTIADSQKKQNDLSAKLSASTKKALEIEKQIVEYKQLAKDYAKQGNESVRKEAEAQIKILNAQKDQAKQAANIVKNEILSLKSLQEKSKLSIEMQEAAAERVIAESKLTEAQREAAKIQEDVNKKFELRDKVTKDIADYEEQIKNTTGENAEYVKRILNEKLKNLKSIQDANKAEIENLSLSEAQLKAREKVAKYETEISDSIGKSLGFLDTMDDKIKSIPVVGGVLSKVLGVDDLKQKLTKDLTKHVLAAGSSFNTAFAAAGGGLKGMAGGIKAMIPSIMSMGATLYASLAPILPILLAITAAVMLVKKALDMDQEVTDMARGLGVSKDQAHEIHSELLDIAETTKVVGANGKELGTAYTELAKSMGVTKLANAKMAETQVLLTKHMGMASEEATAFQKMSMAGGKSSEQNMAVIKAGVESMTGGLMSYKDVAKDIAKSSKAVQASYKGNIAALTKAVVTAKKFGMTLEDTKSSADGLLDIESSLEAEMKANVLTGKHMNLNKARELALQGESAEAVEEMMKQAGGYDELMDMAPYKQKALADAMNMTVEQMIEAAETQKNMQSIAEDVGVALGENGKYTEEQLKQAEAMGNEEAKKLLLAEQTASAQEKMSAIGDKLMAAFSKLAEPIMEMLDPLMEAVDFLFPAIKAALDLAFAPIKYVMGLLSGVVKIFKGDFLGGIHDIGAAIIKFFLRPFTFVYDLLVGFFPSIGKLVDEAIGWVKDKVKGLLPNWALKLLGMGDEDKSKAADPAAAESSVKVDDALIRPGMPPIKFNEDDIIMAGTNLLGESSSGSDSSATNTPTTNPMSEVVSLLKELIAKVDQPIVLKIGSRAISEIESQTSMKRSISTTADKSYGTFGT